MLWSLNAHIGMTGDLGEGVFRDDFPLVKQTKKQKVAREVVIDSKWLLTKAGWEKAIANVHKSEKIQIETTISIEVAFYTLYLCYLL